MLLESGVDRYQDFDAKGASIRRVRLTYLCTGQIRLIPRVVEYLANNITTPEHLASSLPKQFDPAPCFEHYPIQQPSRTYVKP